MSDHSENAIFAAAFPGRSGAIPKLRASDRAFEEVCCDFVALVRLAGRSARVDPALDEALIELRREIEAALGDAATDDSNSNGGSL